MNGYPRDMFEEMDEVFSRLFSRMNERMMPGFPGGYAYSIVIRGDGGPAPLPEHPPVADEGGQSPAAEVHRIGDEVMVVVGLPGASAESVRLGRDGSTLTIDAEGPGIAYHTTAEIPQAVGEPLRTTLRNGILEVSFRAVDPAQ